MSLAASMTALTTSGAPAGATASPLISAARSPGPGIDVPRSFSRVVLAGLQRGQVGLALGAHRDELRVLGVDLGLGLRQLGPARGDLVARDLDPLLDLLELRDRDLDLLAQPADALDDRLVVLLDAVHVVGLADDLVPAVRLEDDAEHVGVVRLVHLDQQVLERRRSRG